RANAPAEWGGQESHILVSVTPAPPARQNPYPLIPPSLFKDRPATAVAAKLLGVSRYATASRSLIFPPCPSFMTRSRRRPPPSRPAGTAARPSASSSGPASVPWRKTSATE